MVLGERCQIWMHTNDIPEICLFQTKILDLCTFSIDAYISYFLDLITLTIFPRIRMVPALDMFILKDNGRFGWIAIKRNMTQYVY